MIWFLFMILKYLQDLKEPYVEETMQVKFIYVGDVDQKPSTYG